MRTNYRVRFGFCGSTVLVAYRGQDVSFYTTVGGDVLLKDIHLTHWDVIRLLIKPLKASNTVAALSQR